MKHTVCIDGQHGTTGLKIHERLEGRDDLDVSEIPEAGRKDPAVRQRYLNEAEIVFLCLPDEAARESVSLIDNPAVRVIDASTALRAGPRVAEAVESLARLLHPELQDSALPGNRP